MQSLFNLTATDPHYVISTVLPTLLDMLNSIDLNVRHGTVLAIAEILETLYNHFDDKIDRIIGKGTCIKNVIILILYRNERYLISIFLQIVIKA